MRKFVMPALATLLLFAPPIAAQSNAGASADDSKDEITDRSDPDYVKCRTESVVGSRAKKRKVCLTNREWAEVARQGRSMATELVEGGRGGIDWEAMKDRDQTCQRVVC